MIFLGIGSNQESKFGNRFLNIRKTIDFIQNEKIKIKKISNFYETPSYPNKRNPKFINIIIQIEFEKDPDNLLKKILIIEEKMERIRGLKNQPRTCDIDIIDFNGLMINKKNINLPHPKAHKRNFVLFPLREICPMWIHPIMNKKVDVLIKNLSPLTRNEITRVKENDILKSNDK
tara:strand:+ start:485 stop:1009 length:525 start_codon:yes stop_codon:yes gene_type:complete